jgi:hypothetical protein
LSASSRSVGGTTGAKNWWMAHYRRWYTFSIPGVASEDATEAGGSAREAGVGTSATMQDPTTTTQPLKVAMAGALGISYNLACTTDGTVHVDKTVTSTSTMHRDALSARCRVMIANVIGCSWDARTARTRISPSHRDGMTIATMAESTMTTTGVQAATSSGKAPSLHPSATMKASRPLICVLVINDDHSGLTISLRYKNRLVPEMN